MASTESLNAEEWVEGAWHVFRESGLSSVRIEPLAKRLNVTKGSFYWHFANRGELIRALMAKWEKQETELIISIAETGTSPSEKLHELFRAVAKMRRDRSGEVTLYVEAEVEGVQHIVRRVTQRRIQYVADILGDMGFNKHEALRRATIATAQVIGLEQLAAGTGQPLDAMGPDLTRTALHMLLAREEPPWQ